MPEKTFKHRFNLPILGLSPPVPLLFKEIPKKQQTSHSAQEYFARVKVWWENNWPVLVLNFGSLCTLTGFTRSDVLELRTFSAMGSFSFVLYNLSHDVRRWNSIAWSCLFATVNCVKIVQILHERISRVVLTEQQEMIFVDKFMPHGVTPKQFEMIWNKAKIVTKKEGEVVTLAGKPSTRIYLVIQGSTRANILGRHLTAASSAPERKRKIGGDSGAWIGEMAFLEQVFEKDHKKVAENDSERELSPPRMLNALYTIVANEDCVLLEWTHSDMEELMKWSTDMRAAMTRAMTAAIVGKVINFTVSRTTVLPNWSTWLDDWKHNAGAKVKVEEQVEEQEADDGDETDAPVLPRTTTVLMHYTY